MTFSPIISIIQNSMMTVQAGSVENYTFRELLNNTIWNNMAIFFPMILALVGGHFIDREYVDDTLKNILCIPISMRRMVAGKLCTPVSYTHLDVYKRQHLTMTCIIFIFMSVFMKSQTGMKKYPLCVIKPILQ